MLEEVIEQDPAFAGGYAGLSEMLSFFAAFDHVDPRPRIERAFALANQAMELDDSLALSHSALACAHLMSGRLREAMDAGRDAVTRQPSDADAHSRLAWCLGFAADWQGSNDAIEIARRLNPVFVNGPYLNIKHLSAAVCGEYEQSIRAFEENARAGGPVGPPALAFAVASCMGLGQTNDAIDYANQLNTTFPGFRLEGWNYINIILDEDVRRQLIELMVQGGVKA